MTEITNIESHNIDIAIQNAANIIANPDGYSLEQRNNVIESLYSARNILALAKQEVWEDKESDVQH